MTTQTPRLCSWLAVAAMSALCACAAREPLPGDPLLPDSGAPTAGPRPGAIENELFMPEVIMERQVQLGLQPAQREAIVREIDRAQGEMLRVKWDLNAEKERLVRLLAAETIDEPRALEAAGRLMDLESRLKAAHLTLLIRLKNQLTKAQQAQLRAARPR